MKTFFLLLMFVVNSARTEVFNVHINEKGTQFDETVEINSKENTVTYKVPAHNDIDQSDTLLDYNSGFSATRMPISKECYIEKISKEEPSLEKTSNDLGRREFVASKNVKMVVETIEKRFLKSASIPRNHLSRKLSEFCGDYAAYEMKRITVDDVEQFSIKRKGRHMQKRFSVIQNVQLPLNRSFFQNTNPGENVTIAAFTCKKLSSYFSEIQRCGGFEHTNFHCTVELISCRYTTICKAPDSGVPVVTPSNSIRGRVHGDKVDVTCKEIHDINSIYCCDIVCSKK